MSKFTFWAAGQTLAFNSKHFSDFLQISYFRKIQMKVAQ